MKSKEEIRELILDKFKNFEVQPNCFVPMDIFRVSIINKLNSQEKDLFYVAANELISEGKIQHERGSGQSGSECYKLTEKGYNWINGKC